MARYRWASADADVAPGAGGIAIETVSGATRRVAVSSTDLDGEHHSVDQILAGDSFIMTGDSYQSNVVSLEPDNYWRVGEAAGSSVSTDQMGGTNGEFVNAPTLGVAGLISGDSDTAMSSLGNGRMRVPGFSGIGAGIETFSISLRARVTADATLRELASCLDASGNGWAIRVNTAGIFFSRKSATGEDTVAAPPPSADAFSLAATYDAGRNMVLYINGGAAPPTVSTRTLPFAFDQLFIGGVVGVTDEPAVWSKAINAATVARLHQVATTALLNRYARFTFTGDAQVMDGGAWVKINAYRLETTGTTTPPPVGTPVRVEWTAGAHFHDEYAADEHDAEHADAFAPIVHIHTGDGEVPDPEARPAGFVYAAPEDLAALLGGMGTQDETRLAFAVASASFTVDAYLGRPLPAWTLDPVDPSVTVMATTPGIRNATVALAARMYKNPENWSGVLSPETVGAHVSRYVADLDLYLAGQRTEWGIA